jgi:hypothetical protein
MASILVARISAIYQTRVQYVSGLPPECRGVLLEFVRQGHKVALPPYNKWVEILTKDGVIRKHSSAGTFDAVSYYFTIDLGFLAFLKAHVPKESSSTSDHEHQMRE